MRPGVRQVLFGRRRTWTPRSLGSSLAGWWDVTDAATVHTTGGVIDSIDDKSGNGHAMAATGTARPAYGATSFQSHVPGITFDGVNDLLAATGVSLGTNKFAAFTFAQFVLTSAPPQMLMTFGTDAETSAGARIITANGSATIRARRNATNFDFADDTLLRTQPGVYLRMGTVWDGSTLSIYRDRQAVASGSDSGNLGATATFGWGGRGDGNFYWPGTAKELILLNRNPTTAEIEQIDNYFLRHWNRIIVAEGDSVTWAPPTGANISYAYRSIPNLSPIGFVMNEATPGIAFNNVGTDIFARAAAHIDALLPTNKNGKKYILTVYTINNLTGVTGNVNDVAVQYGVYAAARKAAGWDKIVWGTPCSRTDAQANDTARNALIAIMRGVGWAAAHNIDAIADFAADAILGVDASPTVNPSYWLDTVHWNAAGHARAEPIYTAAINAL